MILGYEEAGRGPVLVLVHGFPGDRRIWSEQVEGLAGIRRVVAVDLPGRGRSMPTDSSPEGWSMDSYADDLAETVRSLDEGPVDLAGISMGGYILFAFWRRHPELVRSLILVSTRSTEDPPEGKQGRKNVAALVREKGTAELIPMMFPKLFHPSTGEEAKQKVKAIVDDLPSETAAADSLAMGKRADSTEDLPSIAVPVLVLAGEHDELTPPDRAQEMAGATPRSKFELIPRSAHFLILENPGAVNDAIFRFLSGQALP